MASASTWTIYQPLIVGLGAVVLATFGNTLLEWFRQSLQDRREARVVRRAFSEELRAHRRNLSEAFPDTKPVSPDENLVVPFDRFLPVYDNLIGKIGILRPGEVAALLNAYSYIILVPKNLLLIGRAHRDEQGTFVEVPGKYAFVLRSHYKEQVRVIDEALKALGCEVELASKPQRETRAEGIVENDLEATPAPASQRRGG